MPCSFSRAASSAGSSGRSCCSADHPSNSDSLRRGSSSDDETRLEDGAKTKQRASRGVGRRIFVLSEVLHAVEKEYEPVPITKSIWTAFMTAKLVEGQRVRLSLVVV